MTDASPAREDNCSGWWETPLHSGPCELSPGHAGPHGRIGDASSARPAPLCGALYYGTGKGEDVCSLPDGHDGAHSWEARASALRTWAKGEIGRDGVARPAPLWLDVNGLTDEQLRRLSRSFRLAWDLSYLDFARETRTLLAEFAGAASRAAPPELEGYEIVGHWCEGGSKPVMRQYPSVACSLCRSAPAISLVERRASPAWLAARFAGRTTDAPPELSDEERVLADAVRAAAPSGPWRITTNGGVGDAFRYVVVAPHEQLFLRTEPEAIAVRDALNRVAALRRTEAPHE